MDGMVRRESPMLILNANFWCDPDFRAELDEIMIAGMESGKSLSQIEADVVRKLQEPISDLIQATPSFSPTTQRIIESLLIEIDAKGKAHGIVFHYMPDLARDRGLKLPSQLDRKPYRPLIRLRRRR